MSEFNGYAATAAWRIMPVIYMRAGTFSLPESKDILTYRDQYAKLFDGVFHPFFESWWEGRATLPYSKRDNSGRITWIFDARYDLFANEKSYSDTAGRMLDLLKTLKVDMDISPTAFKRADKAFTDLVSVVEYLANGKGDFELTTLTESRFDVVGTVAVLRKMDRKTRKETLSTFTDVQKQAIREFMTQSTEWINVGKVA